MDGTLRMGSKLRIFLYYMKAYQQTIAEEKVLKDPASKMGHSEDVSQHLSEVIPLFL